MGNQITAIAPAQILPLENYFNDLADYGKPNRSAPFKCMQISHGKKATYVYADATVNMHVHDCSIVVLEAQDSSRWHGPLTGV